MPDELIFDHETYLSPFTWRYGSPEMRRLWSEAHKRRLWRRIWVALAEAQAAAGLVTPAQVADLRVHLNDIDLARSQEIEAEIHHDLMAEVRVYAEQCPVGGGIIHLGATSMDVEDNADALRVRDALELILERLRELILTFAKQIEAWADAPTMAFTHLQPAEPTTIGYRLAQYAQDLWLDWKELDRVRATLRGKGFKGAVGTSASYVQLLDLTPQPPSLRGKGELSPSPLARKRFGELDSSPLARENSGELDSSPFARENSGELDSPPLVGEGLGERSVERFERQIMAALNLEAFPVTTQTYPRKQDYQVLSALAGLGGSLYKFAFDLRILQSPPIGEWAEPFGAKQVGSSAMPFKRNPINAENMDSLARLLAALPRVAWDNAAHSLLERTLDDSANRRSILPQAFLIADELVRRARRLVTGLQINRDASARLLATYGVFAATERLLMETVRRGGDRQELHEVIREHSLVAWAEVRAGRPNPLADRLCHDPRITRYASPEELRAWLDAAGYVGNAPARARRFAQMLREQLKTKRSDGSI